VDLAAEILHNPWVVDLVITLSFVGANGSRKDTFFEPYPFGVEVDLCGEKLNFGNAPNKKWDVLIEVLKKLPSIKEMTAFGSTQKQLKVRLDQIDPLCYPLLRWIVTSNRCHLKKLESHELIKEIGTEFQFELKSLPPAKERKFQEMKKKHTSFYAYHGSPFANWHSILRAGLKNQSGTGKQIHGAAYGSGVYLAPNSTLSTTYSHVEIGATPIWEKSMFVFNKTTNAYENNRNLSCLALCEVINSEFKDVKSGATTTMYVVPDENNVSTRYFFIFTANQNGKPDVLANKLTLNKK